MTADQLPLTENLVTQVDTLCDIHDNITKIIGEIDIPVDELSENYENIKFSRSGTFELDEMARLFIYKEVVQYSQAKLADRVDEWPYLQTRFGLDHGPTQQEISYVKRTKFSRRFRNFLETVGSEIREIAQNQGIRVRNQATPDTNPDPDEVADSPQPVEQYVDDHAPNLISTMVDDICSPLDTGRAENTVHEDEEVWEHQILMSMMD